MAVSAGTKTKRPKKISIDAVVLATIEKHAYSILDAEVGGMLFGSVANGITTIVGSVPASKASAEQISLTFTHEVWDDILKQGQELYPDMQIVGWYHTHPSFGLFLSEYDAFIQKNFFANAGQIALVIDPIAGDMGWFAYNSKSEKIDKVFTESTVTGPKRAPRSMVEEAKPKGTSKLVIACLASALMAGLAGWGIANSAVPVDLSEAVYAQNQQIDDLRQTLGQYVGEPPYQFTISYISRRGDTLRSITDFFYGKGADEALLIANNPDFKSEKIAENSQLLIVNPAGFNAVPGEPAPIPTDAPEPTATPESGVTPSPSATSKPIATATPAPTATSKPLIILPSQTPSATPLPSASATATQ